MTPLKFIRDGESKEICRVTVQHLGPGIFEAVMENTLMKKFETALLCDDNPESCVLIGLKKGNERTLDVIMTILNRDEGE